ncbi:MAG: class I SAM-dependent methyltransferase [Acidobacteriaceae bacterium]
MPPLLWSGKLTLPMKMLVNANSILSVVTGQYSDLVGMKDRVKRGYEGKISDHVQQYDRLGYQFQDRAARVQLEGMPLHEMSVLDVGCGTGALAQVAVEQGSGAVNCGDISAFMLQEARKKPGLDQSGYTYTQLDAERLPYRDGTFDAVLSGMTFGLLPDQEQAVAEMTRVAKRGGLVCVGAHGPMHYWQAIDASFRCITKRYILGYRLEWWPRPESYLRALLEHADLETIHTRRVTWENKFTTGAEAYDFFAAISASWWYEKFPADEIVKDSLKTRNYFQRKNVNVITDDIVIGYGRKR